MLSNMFPLSNRVPGRRYVPLKQSRGLCQEIRVYVCMPRAQAAETGLEGLELFAGQPLSSYHQHPVD